MLRPQEMNREMRNQQKQPTVIAKLMGLDALPLQHSVSAIEKPRSKNNNENVYTIAEAIHKHHLHGNTCSGKTVPPNSRKSNLQSNEKIEIRDVCEVQNQLYRTNNRSVLSSSGKYHDNPYEKRMALVHRNFVQAKRLARNENLLQSREFQDALEVLSSNRDLFLKLLEEPNPWLSKHSPEVQPSSQITHNKCITVLKPSRMMAEHIQEQSTINDPHVQANEVTNLIHRKSYSTANPTRIVVLKPNPGKSYDGKDDESVPSSSQRFPETDNVCQETGDHETRFSREVAKEITRKMQQRLGINRRDETLLPPVLSNSYAGGEVSLRRSLNECMEEEWGNASSQSRTPRHSWDCTDRCLSPCSLSSLSQTSLSPESSVVREAKKHLSERWVMVSRTGVNQKHDRCSSNTLGKMLAVPDVDREDGHESPAIFGSRTFSGEHEIRKKHAETSEASKKSVQMMRSIRASENILSDTQDGKSLVAKDGNIQTTARSLFKEKISSLFSSRNKKFTGSLPPTPSAKTLHKFQPQETTGDAPEGPQYNYEDILKKNICSTPEPDRLSWGSLSGKEALTLEMKLTSENTIENMEQPSPISVLETAFEVEESKHSSSVPSSVMNQECRVVSRIPMIDSITRSLSWDEDDLVETSNMEEPLNSPGGAEEEEWSNFVRTLLAASGLSNETSAALANRLHPLDGPLDTALLEKYVEPKREGAKSRQRRSNQLLIFDSINFALLEIIRDETSDNHKLPIACSNEPCEELARMSLTERVLLQLHEWFSVGSEGTIGQGKSSRSMIDAAIQNQVIGKVWGDMMKAEIIEMGREIERRVMDELVGEMLDGFVYRLL